MKELIESKLTGAVLVPILVVLFGLNVLLSQLLLSTNTVLVNTVHQTNGIRELIAKERIELSQKTATQTIAKKAKKLDFSNTQQVLYLAEMEALAKK